MPWNGTLLSNKQPHFAHIVFIYWMQYNGARNKSKKHIYYGHSLSFDKQTRFFYYLCYILSFAKLMDIKLNFNFKLKKSEIISLLPVIGTWF